jgi:hypothetical protein
MTGQARKQISRHKCAKEMENGLTWLAAYRRAAISASGERNADIRVGRLGGFRTSRSKPPRHGAGEIEETTRDRKVSPPAGWKAGVMRRIRSLTRQPVMNILRA